MSLWTASLLYPCHRASVPDRGRSPASRPETRFGADALAPDSVEYIVPADDLAAIADQVFKQIEDLRMNGHNGVLAAELAPPGVKDVTVPHLAKEN
jgi:hypothetical protein